MKQYYFYKATNLANQKAYVGYTGKTINERWAGHLTESRTGSECHLHRSIRKYGAECWTVEELYKSWCSKKTACRIEKDLIAEHRTFINGMNMTLGGDGGDLYSKKTLEEKKAIAEKKKATRLKNFGTLGWTQANWAAFNNQSPEQKEEIRLRRSATCRSKSPETMMKVMESKSKRTTEQNILSGEKIGAQVKLCYNKRKQDPITWAKYIKELKDRTSKKVHTPIGIFDSLEKASEGTGIANTTLRRRIKNNDHPDFFYV